MIRRLIALLLCITPVSYGWQWPVSDPVVVATFGQYDGESLFRGITLVSDSPEVIAIAPGTVVFTGSGSLSAGPYAFVVVRHDEGFLSLYGHLGEAGLPTIGSRVDESTVIGVAEPSFRRAGRECLLSIFDLDEQSSVNPLLLLPDLADTRRPRIDSVTAIRGADRIDLFETDRLVPAEYELVTSIYDVIGVDGGRVAPYAVTLYVGGRERFSVLMERIKVAGVAAQVGPATEGSVDRLYRSDGRFSLGTVLVTEGTTVLEIVVTDFAGNESTETLVLRWEPPPDEDIQQDTGSGGD
jgi:hypothetical protein